MMQNEKNLLSEHAGIHRFAKICHYKRIVGGTLQEPFRMCGS